MTSLRGNRMSLEDKHILVMCKSYMWFAENMVTAEVRMISSIQKLILRDRRNILNFVFG